VAQGTSRKNRPRSVSRHLGEVDVLHWKPRLVALTALLALVLIALAGLGTEIAYNLYW